MPSSDAQVWCVYRRRTTHTVFERIDGHFDRFSQYLSLNSRRAVRTLRYVERAPAMIAAQAHNGRLLPPATATEAAALHESSLRAFVEADFDRAIALTDQCRAVLEPHILAQSQRMDRVAANIRCSIIIVTYRDEPDFLPALRRIAEAVTTSAFEVIVVNNGNPVARSIVEQFDSWHYVEVGFNYGCSGGRNVGAMLASGKYVLFLDDDGLVEPNCIDHLVKTIEDNHASAVRGRVVPKTDGGLTSLTYDLGTRMRPSSISAEGVSIFRRDLYLEAGGFDPLLSGHEGQLITATLVKMTGPFSVLYEPHAVLRHDYAESPEAAAAKKERQQRNRGYVEYRAPGAERLAYGLKKLLRQTEGGVRFALRRRYAALANIDEPTDGLPPMSVLTTARNGSAFLEEYASSLKRQTHTNFEIIFVDDGSTDDTIEKIRSLFVDDDRLHVVPSEALGRAAALNLAVKHARHDICLIADADDISTRFRLAASARLLHAAPELSCLSLWVYNERNVCWTGQPQNFAARDFRIRSLFGMPASFPAFAFRKSRFTDGFDASIDAAIDFEWIARNMRSAGVRGEVFPLHGSYYRQHAAQISATKRDQQRRIAVSVMIAQHEALLGPLTETEKRAVAVLSGWEPAGQRDLHAVRTYQLRLLEGAFLNDTALSDQLALALSTRLSELARRAEIAQIEAAWHAERVRQSRRPPPGIKKSARLFLAAVLRRFR